MKEFKHDTKKIKLTRGRKNRAHGTYRATRKPNSPLVKGK
jgi:hypothetical protein